MKRTIETNSWISMNEKKQIEKSVANNPETKFQKKWIKHSWSEW